MLQQKGLINVNVKVTNSNNGKFFFTEIVK